MWSKRSFFFDKREEEVVFRIGSRLGQSSVVFRIDSRPNQCSSDVQIRQWT